VCVFYEKTISQKGKKEKEKLDSVFLSGAPFPALGLRVRRGFPQSAATVVVGGCSCPVFPARFGSFPDSSSPSYLPSLSSTTNNTTTIATAFFLLISCKDWHLLHCS
jgi:hypothetical protein